MPAKPQWLLQIPAILEQLRAIQVPVVDREGFERMFSVGRRRAVDLMHRFGGYQSGHTILVDRVALIERLEEVGSGEDAVHEQHRKTRLAEELDRLHRCRAGAAVQIAVLPVAASGLPEGVAFDGGRMIVEFAGVEQLLSRLYALAQTAAADYDAFQAAVAGNQRACA